MSKTDLVTLIRENPEYGGEAQQGSAIFKGKMIWPSGRVVTLKPVSVYLGSDLEDHVQAVAILDMPFDRVVVSIRRNIKDNVYPVTPYPDGDVSMVVIYEGIASRELTGSVGFRHIAGSLEIYMIEVTFKLEFGLIKKKAMMDEFGKPPSLGEKLTFKLSEGHFMF
ncbi:hypothetical protein N5F23_07555 [Pseudomonas sichuanensis]|uniref:hypothetical protein n=1 Tax=Pseudomonas sichuanensis TaxID=2213015 RepID=UPI002448063A|nr:hypothetical protein [Pseudomonas sichuanensis]MDH0729832.1 hypothetical protein [Pseudomonas sichuanensis]MDH1582446.1 hypothetical protein [Pseudomonas sichuanensis]MDH1591203.1 hypothetical protein [Pseudomonas sichuanensis]MDH1597439.1 hypothetical protein [Pseudomonas sichuanensis]